MALDLAQFHLARAFISATAGLMTVAAVYFFVARRDVAEQGRRAVELAALVCGVAAFHYWRTIDDWTAAYAWDGDRFQPTDQPFVDSARYADWVVTVPLLLLQLVFVLDLPRPDRARFGSRLVVASMIILGLGYVGEVSSERETKLLFLGLGFVPLLYVVYVLWASMSGSLARIDEQLALRVARARLVLLLSWLLYPVAFVFPLLGWDEGWGLVIRQAGYGIADSLSKPLFGLMILQAALRYGEPLVPPVPSAVDRSRARPPLPDVERSR